MDRAFFDRMPKTVCISASQVVAKGPCVVVGVTVAAIGAAATAVLYDGVDTGSERKLTLGAIDGGSAGGDITKGIRFDRGIYATVNAVTTFISISFYMIISAENEFDDAT